ncbi:MAG TPA: hypothetical protein VHE55_06730 [Fimbriimonadaceae bacterium]|nr:hypothetical protein [Fimbriimonadaceae bacterium]
MAEPATTIDLCPERHTLRLRLDGDKPRVEAFKGDGEPVCAFDCTVGDLRSVAAGANLQRSAADGYLLVQPSREAVWIIVSSPEKGFSESCLVPRAEFERAIATRQ